MVQLREYVSTRVLVDYDYFFDNVSNPVLVCTNQGVLNIIRTLISTYGLRYANWVTAHTGGGYIGVDASQFDNIDRYISEFLEETSDMTFCEDLTEALNGLSASFQAGCCNEGSFGADGSEPPASTNEDDELDWPPGFDTYAEYRAYKCDIANRIIEGLRIDATWLSGATIVTLAASILIATLLTPIPGDEILALVGFCLALLAQGVLSATAAGLATDLDTHRQELVCILYDAVNATDAKAGVTSFLAGVLTVSELALFGSMWGFANINALYDRDVLLEASPLPDAVICTACTSECELVIPFNNDPVTSGTYTIVSPTVITMVNGQAAAVRWGICDFNTNPVDFTFCGPSVELVSYALVGFTPWATSAYRIYNSALTIVYNSSTPPDWSLFTDVRRVQLKSTTDFTGTITLVA